MSDESILTRWSRRKLASQRSDGPAPADGGDGSGASEVEGGEAAPPAPRRGIMNTEPSGPTVAERLPSEAPARSLAASEGAGPDSTANEIELPSLDTLDASSDYTAFMRDGVSEELKNAALRKLWRLNPVFANLDGLNDYDDDFTDAAVVVKGLKSLYRTGKGMPGRDEREPPEPAAEAPTEQADDRAVAAVPEPAADDSADETTADEGAVDGNPTAAAADRDADAESDPEGRA
jgi:hypothetical protein